MNYTTETINGAPTIIGDACIQCVSETCEFIPLHLTIEQSEQSEQPEQPEQPEQSYRQFSECVCGWRMIEGMGQECICY